jgi:hypothetical protein
MKATLSPRRFLLGALCFVWATTGVRSEFQFSEPVFYQIGHGAGPFAVEDFDGDGDADLIVGNLDFGTVTLLRNDGAGLLASPVHGIVGEAVAGLASGDLDGDLDADLAIADDGLFSKSIVPLINSGDGSFEVGERTVLFDADDSTLLYLRGIVLGDFNGDSLPDVAVGCETSQPTEGFVEVALNQGGGVFGEVAHLTTGQIGLTLPKNLVAVDFSGEGRADLVAINRTPDPALFEATESGGFIPVAPGPSVFVIPSSILSGDLDSDGDEDLLLASEGGRRVEVRFNDSNKGFSSPQAIATGATRPGSPAFGDFDGDGDLDLAVAELTETFLYPSRGAPALYLAENDGSGSFQPALTLGFGEYPGIPEWIETADLDGDGDTDILVSDRIEGKIAVYFNQHIPAAFSSGDLDEDGILGLLDLLVFGNTWYLETSP